MKTMEELAEFRKKACRQTGLREEHDILRVVVAMGTCGITAGALDTKNAFTDELKKRNIQDVFVSETGCLGLCEQEPIVDVYTPNKGRITYGRVTPERARQIVVNHIVNDKVLGDWVITTR